MVEVVVVQEKYSQDASRKITELMNKGFTVHTFSTYSRGQSYSDGVLALMVKGEMPKSGLSGLSNDER